MTIKQWLQNVHYDDYGQYLWANHDDGNQLIGEVRGWGALQQEFKTEAGAEAFQDEVGKFIADAINEKIKRDFGGDKEGEQDRENKTVVEKDKVIKVEPRLGEWGC
jgi:hypothetical protein